MVLLHVNNNSISSTFRHRRTTHAPVAGTSPLSACFGITPQRFFTPHALPYHSFKYWHYALRIVTNVRNNLLHSGTGVIPSVTWLGAVQDLSHLRAFGSVTYHCIRKALRKAHEPRAINSIYLGHRNRHIQYFLSPNTSTVYERIFFNISYILQAYNHQTWT